MLVNTAFKGSLQKDGSNIISKHVIFNLCLQSAAWNLTEIQWFINSKNVLTITLKPVYNEVSGTI